jgi:hypothetical protein
MRTVQIALLLILIAATASHAQPRIGTWTRQDTPSKKPATLSIKDDGVISIEASDAVSFFYRPFPKGDARHRLSWRWRVDAMPPAAPLDIKGADDRPLAVHVVYPAPADGGFLDSLSRGLRGVIAGPLFRGRMITYVFGGKHPAGTLLRNPFLPRDAVLIVLRDGTTPTGEWFNERVDPSADYARAFGGVAPEPILLSISSDTDDRGGTARAGIIFED